MSHRFRRWNLTEHFFVIFILIILATIVTFYAKHKDTNPTQPTIVQKIHHNYWND